MARGQLQQVILVEVAETDRDRLARVRAPGGRRPRDANRPGRRARLVDAGRHWRVAVAVVAVVAAAVLVPGLQSRQRDARVAVVPGVLARLDPALPERWRAPGRGWGALAALGDHGVLVSGRDLKGASGVTSLDAVTGEQVWSTPFREVTADGSLRCIPLDDGGAHVVCLVLTGKPLATADGAADPRSNRPVEPARLVALSAATGELAAVHELDSDNAMIAAAGSDVVVTEVLPDGRAAVRRLDPVSGTQRWAFRSEVAMRTPSASPARLVPSVMHGVVVANGPVTWAFAPDGTVLGEWHLQGGDWAVRGGWGLDVTVLPDGRFAVGESGGVGLADDDYGTVSTADARDGFAIPGAVLVPTVDDGTAPDILFTVPAGQGGIVALDALTGERLWAFGADTWGDALVLDRRVVMVVGREIQAQDARSGRLLWSVAVPMGNHARQVFTDGRVVLVPRFDPERGAVLTALDPADGRERWTAQLPVGSSSLVSLQGRLLARAQGNLIAVG